MRVGIYIDGYNVYYGARGLCGRGAPGWRWLDLRALSGLILSRLSRWQGAAVGRIVYCTAVIDAASNPSGYTDQDIYLKALAAANSVDQIAYGSYVARVKYAPLAVKAASRSGNPQIVHPRLPIMVQDAQGNPIPDATFMVSYAAVVISNDSDLEFPISYARTKVPVGLLNPSSNYLAGALGGQPSDGVGNHWWQRLSAATY